MSWGPGDPRHPTERDLPVWVCGQRLGSPSHTLSLLASWRCRKYPAIRSPRQREGYKGIFQDQLAEYTELLGEVRATRRRLGELEAAMGQLPQHATRRTVGPLVGAGCGHRVLQAVLGVMSWLVSVGTQDEPGGLRWGGMDMTPGGHVDTRAPAAERHEPCSKAPSSCWKTKERWHFSAVPWARFPLHGTAGRLAAPEPPGLISSSCLVRALLGQAEPPGLWDVSFCAVGWE